MEPALRAGWFASTALEPARRSGSTQGNRIIPTHGDRIGRRYWMNSALLEMRGIGKSFPGVKALQGVDFTVRAGEIHALLGENGAGKSTLIKVLTGVHPAAAGEIRLGGTLIRPSAPKEARSAAWIKHRLSGGESCAFTFRGGKYYAWTSAGTFRFSELAVNPPASPGRAGPFGSRVRCRRRAWLAVGGASANGRDRPCPRHAGEAARARRTHCQFG